jgi:hypothetical protein
LPRLSSRFSCSIARVQIHYDLVNRAGERSRIRRIPLLKGAGHGAADNDNKHEVAAYKLQLSHLPVEEHFVPSVICDSSKSIFYPIRKVAAPVRLRSLMKLPRSSFLLLLTLVALGRFGMPVAIAQQPTSSASTSPPPSSAPEADTSGAMDDKWHIGFAPYLWFPGMHGTSGIRGFDTSVRASAGDLLSHFNIGLMGTTEVRKNHFVSATDLMWVRLSDDKALPVNEVGINSISFRAGQFLLTPMGGYRVVDKEKLKVDGLAGLRYWHLGQKIEFSPTILNGVSASQNWVDALGGARFLLLLTPKVSASVIGDAGGGGANSDYEIAGLLGLKVKKNIDLKAGWRYLVVDYRNSSNQYLYNVASSGFILGALFNFK